MKKIISLTLLFVAIMGVHCSDKSIRVATWNIRRAGTEKSNDLLWENRKKDVVQTIQDTLQPDVLCLQEVVIDQINDLRQSLQEEYAYVGSPRKSHASSSNVFHWISKPFAQDEYNPIFYKKDRFNLAGSGTFNVNPAIYGSGWLPRICTWVLLEEKGEVKEEIEGKKTNKRFYVFNTHLDNSSDRARRIGLANVISEIESRSRHEIPALLLGDFNMPEEDFEKFLPATPMTFAKEHALESKEGPQFTHYDWKEVIKNKGTIDATSKKTHHVDHILIDQGPTDQNSGDPLMTVESYSVMELKNWKISDHYPVVIEIR